MSLMDIAIRTGVPLIDIEDLVRGAVTDKVAERCGVPQLALEEFIRHGQAGSRMAHRLGMSMASAEELARALGSEGAGMRLRPVEPSRSSALLKGEGP